MIFEWAHKHPRMQEYRKLCSHIYSEWISDFTSFQDDGKASVRYGGQGVVNVVTHEFLNFLFPLNTGSVMDSDLCLHSLTSRKTSDNCKKIQITVKVWWQVSLEGQAAGKIVMQFSKTFSNGIKTEEERLKGHAQWPIFVNRSNRCSSKVAGLGLEKTSQPIWKTQFIIFTGLFFTQKIWRILTAFFQR